MSPNIEIRPNPVGMNTLIVRTLMEHSQMYHFDFYFQPELLGEITEHSFFVSDLLSDVPALNHGSVWSNVETYWNH